MAVGLGVIIGIILAFILQCAPSCGPMASSKGTVSASEFPFAIAVTTLEEKFVIILLISSFLAS